MSLVLLVTAAAQALSACSGGSSDDDATATPVTPQPTATATATAISDPAAIATATAVAADYAAKWNSWWDTLVAALDDATAVRDELLAAPSSAATSAQLERLQSAAESPKPAAASLRALAPPDDFATVHSLSLRIQDDWASWTSWLVRAFTASQAGDADGMNSHLDAAGPHLDSLLAHRNSIRDLCTAGGSVGRLHCD
jgi:hypothetical protein